ncbi:glycosyltransferase [Mycolicibacterium sp. 22603]|uniref:glycosyltransferase n=1 Tax=Mycolicibacterium sp. 22603 TaxID=3453950 RepID=UPI003F857C51
MTAIRHVEVVVPARNEQQHIADCLRSIVRAGANLGTEVPGASWSITVVLDCCTDDTGPLAARFGVHLLTTDTCVVGTARKVGTAAAIDRAVGHGRTLDTVWIACTDADTVVPEHWLTRQLSMASDGADAVIGTAVPAGLGPEMHRRWMRCHNLTEGHSHVHGANLGFRADVYLRAGGFPECTTGEDVKLVQQIRAITPRCVATHSTSVRTSGRGDSRVEGGFASFLAALGEEAI